VRYDVELAPPANAPHVPAFGSEQTTPLREISRARRAVSALEPMNSA
jgi:hypothetical protein